MQHHRAGVVHIRGRALSTLLARNEGMDPFTRPYAIPADRVVSIVLSLSASWGVDHCINPYDSPWV